MKIKDEWGRYVDLPDTPQIREWERQLWQKGMMNGIGALDLDGQRRDIQESTFDGRHD